MRTIAVVCVVALGLAANYFSRHTRAERVVTTEHHQITKCVAENGDTYYGEVPSGVVCKGIEMVDVSTSSGAPSTGDKSDGIVSQFRCDGRMYCSQMTSCEEASYFLKNCPNVKMDGDGDGIPCERQWCK